LLRRDEGIEDEEQTINGTNGADIPQEQAIEQQTVPFMGDEKGVAYAISLRRQGGTDHKQHEQCRYSRKEL
jgi:hypothetical protein